MIRSPTTFATWPSHTARSPGAARPVRWDEFRPVVRSISRKGSSRGNTGERIRSVGVAALARRSTVVDWTGGVIRAIEPDGHGEVVAEHHSLPLCFDFLPDGTLVLASGPHRALLRMASDGTFAQYADLSALSPYPS